MAGRRGSRGPDGFGTVGNAGVPGSRGVATDGGVERRERTYRGISLRAATRYLEGLGGEPVAGPDAGAGGEAVDVAGGEAVDVAGGEKEDVVTGDGDGPDSNEGDASTVVEAGAWRATLSAETVGVGPTLHLTEVTVVFEGDSAVLDDVVEAFSRKALRAGG